MTKEEAISIAVLARKVDELARDMITKDLLKAELGRIDEAVNAHVLYTRAAATAETSRVNSILLTNAETLKQANIEANESTVAANTQTERVASTLRDLVETTRSANSKSLSEVINPIMNRLNEIEQKQYEGKGKDIASEPVMQKFIERMEKVTDAMNERQGEERVIDPIMVDLNKKVDAMIIALATTKGRAGLSNALQMVIAGLCSSVVTYIILQLLAAAHP